MFDIEPKALFDFLEDVPNLMGKNNKQAPGKYKPYTFDPTQPGDDAEFKWDVSRQIRIRIKNPGQLSMNGENPAAWYVNQPQNEDVPVDFPQLDAEGNDDPPLKDEASSPYTAFSSPDSDLDHQIGEMASIDSPKLSIGVHRGEPGAYFTKELDFREFARVELWDGKRQNGQYWFRISEHKTWHHHLKTTFDGDISQWTNSGSSSGLGN